MTQLLVCFCQRGAQAPVISLCCLLLGHSKPSLPWKQNQRPRSPIECCSLAPGSVIWSDNKQANLSFFCCVKCDRRIVFVWFYICKKSFNDKGVDCFISTYMQAWIIRFAVIYSHFVFILKRNSSASYACSSQNWTKIQWKDSQLVW